MAAAYDEIICTFPLFSGFTKHGAQELLEISRLHGQHRTDRRDGSR